MPNLCFHVNSFCSKVSVDRDQLNEWVGRLEDLLKRDPRTYVLKCKELSLLLKLWTQGIYNPPDSPPLEYWSYKLGQHSKLSTFNGLTVNVEGRFKDEFLNSLRSLPPSDPNTIACWAGLMKLSSLVTLNPSREDKRDIGKILFSPFTGNPSVFKELREPIFDVVQRLIQQSKIPDVLEYIPVHAHVANPLKGSFYVIEDGTKIGTTSRDDLRPYNLNTVLRDPEVRSLYERFPDPFISSAFIGERTRGARVDFSKIGDPLDKRVPLGQISVICEPGGKFRVVNNPHLLLSSLSAPLRGVLTSIYQQWKVQGCMSHDDTVAYVQARLRLNDEGVSFESIDSKAFTDRLPFKGFQDQILMALVKYGAISEYDKSVMDLICNATYYCPSEEQNKFRQYGVGTPQGTYPSFPLATLANGILLWIATEATHQKRFRKNNLPGRVIGDDIVIWDEKVARKYRELLVRLGVEISTSKSLASPYVCEMCSKIIHYNGIFRQQKIKVISDVQSYLESYRVYGDDLVASSLRLEEWTRLLKSIPEPYGLGLGFDEYGSCRISHESDMYKVFKTVHIVSELGLVTRRRPSRDDLELTAKRVDLYPEIRISEIDRQIDQTYVPVLPVIESVYDDIERTFKMFLDAPDEDEKLRLSASLQSMYNTYLEFSGDVVKQPLSPPFEGVCPTHSSGQSLTKLYDWVGTIPSLLGGNNDGEISI